MRRSRRLAAAIFATAAVIALVIYIATTTDLISQAISLIDADLTTPLFLLLMATLPLLGFPISIFLVGTGIKFHFIPALLIWLAMLFIHAVSGYWAAKLFRPLLEKLLLSTLHYAIPAIPSTRQFALSALFLAFPGFPYAIKNYLLPLSGVSFRYCVFLNCLVQGILGVPFIFLGYSGEQMNPILIFLAVLTIMILVILLRWLKERHQSTMKYHDKSS
jgi:uncharacterized membrane protein YdjX (TVP38/TMEM64 family)